MHGVTMKIHRPVLKINTTFWEPKIFDKIIPCKLQGKKY
jgi:hypothetical protein